MGVNQIKILAIDDNPDNLVILKALISDSFPDAHLMTAQNGIKGIELAASEDPDVVLLDVVMPLIDGFEVCRKIKSDFRTSDIPVIFLTAQKYDRESRIKAMEVSADAFLAKPIDENELIAQIRAMIKIKWGNVERRHEKERLAKIVDEKTLELKRTYVATLNLLEDLNRENEARKRNEEALKKSEESLVDIFETVSEGIIYASLSGEILSVNSSLENLINLKKEFLVGKNGMVLARELLNRKNMKAVLPIIKNLISGKEQQSFQIEYHDKILEITVSINKTTKRMTGVIRDITQKKKAEEDLISSEKKFRTLVENAFDGIYLTNGKYFYFVNERFCEITGYSTDELTSPDFDFQVTLSAESRKLVEERNSLRRLNKNLAGTYEMTIIAKNGERRIVEVSTVNLGQGKDLNVLGIVRDITERKRIESQVIQSERLSALGEMSAGLAHEINQPLNTLSILFDNILLESKTPGSVSREYLEKKSEKIFENITRMRNLIDHVRDFSRSQDGYIHNLFEVNKGIYNAITMIGEQLRIRGIELQLDLGNDLPAIKGNIYKFEQVILNLLSNARDALLEKQIRLGTPYPMMIRIVSKQDAKHIKIIVSDNGPGIKEDNLERIFQPFFTTKEAGQGTGLGLSISYGIIQEMNGKLTVESQADIGTKITITIPVNH
jgi:PAS domain S-box-containing protein